MLKRLSLAIWISLSIFSATLGFATDSFKVLSYNAENVWDDVPDNTLDTWRTLLSTLPQDQRSGLKSHFLQYLDYHPRFSNWYDPDIIEAKIQHFVEVIRLLGAPDILALQEFESAGNNSHVFDMKGKRTVLRKAMEKLGYREFILGHQKENNPVSVIPAIISKLPLTELPSVPIIDEQDAYSTSTRDIQVVEFRENNNRMLIFNNHWKSKIGGPKTDAMRVKIAEVLRERIAEERKAFPGTRIIVAGDLNSSYFEKPVLAIPSTGDEDLMRKGTTPKLYNLWYELSENDRWETSYRGQPQTLSNMLISDDFYYTNGIQYVDNSFEVPGQKGKLSEILLNADGTPFRWQIRREDKLHKHIGQGYSDHLPLLASFKIGPNDASESLKSKSKHSLKPELESAPHFDQVKICQENDFVNISQLDFTNMASWFGKCVKIIGSFPLQANTHHESSFIKLEQSLSSTLPEASLTITMTRSYDARPNIDDSRIDDSIIEGDSDSAYRRSNKCYVNKILSGDGGLLLMAAGRLGYAEGNIALFVPTRESRDILLESLPDTKDKECKW